MFNNIFKKQLFVPVLLLLSSCGVNPAIDGNNTINQSVVDSKSKISIALDSSPDNYVLGQGDEISIFVFDEPDLTLDARVSASGFINYSYLGNIQVTNKTPLQLEEHIAELLRNGYLVNPSVNVSVTQFRPFYIGGEVRSPGSYPYQPGLTLERAIALAGGLSDRASERRMYVARAGSDTSQEKISLGDTVGPGDTITIQEGFF